MNKNKNKGKTRQDVLDIIATDNTFHKMGYPTITDRTFKLNDDYVWQGKCIFCNKKLLVGKNGNLIN